MDTMLLKVDIWPYQAHTQLCERAVQGLICLALQQYSLAVAVGMCARPLETPMQG